VISGTTYTISSLNTGIQYYFAIDSYNGSGVTKGVEVSIIANSAEE